MGVPSVKREVHSYLADTLNSLMSELSPTEKEDSVIVVFIAEPNIVMNIRFAFLPSVCKDLKGVVGLVTHHPKCSDGLAV
ncbi:Alpha-1,3-mannosyl-glycoprotein 4-beta-N-acetylglucosaminyltransferase B [Triplophysa tibetana]|uniref:Alpha-1,3-mannosyl-glycoprotein 4-beta-N-acetylglucosaminyltransferase B n=1 Tax=Triplophysa tibetana TaxID=1572043 RepID=A0A5A9NII4_9TELE|nr:Alpha-1,3-mannosyl-glycoprotein 4-beta-N-acetylglucosaminyltransferase B [Triplophysa tibetana]